MKKEYVLALAIGLYIFSQALDSLQGNVLIPIKSPFDFTSAQVLNTYPFTAVSVVIKVLGIVLTAYLFLSLIPRAHFLKAIILFVVAGLTELYAIQQFATKIFILTMPWTVALAYAAVGLLLLAILEILLGFFKGVHNKFSEKPRDVVWEDSPED